MFPTLISCLPGNRIIGMGNDSNRYLPSTNGPGSPDGLGLLIARGNLRFFDVV